MKKKFLALMMATVLATSPVVTNVATAYAAEANTDAEDNKLAVNETSVSVTENKTKAVILESPAENCTYKAVSADKNIATAQIKENTTDIFIITAVNYGSTTVTIEEYDAEGNKTGKTAEVKVNVTVSQDAFKKAFKDISMNAGDTKTLEAILPEGYTFSGNNISFETSDTNISIDGNKIKALKNGEATVTAILLKGKNHGATEDLTATFKVSVKTFVTDITVANNKVSMTKGSTYELKPVVKPDTATDKSVSYESSDKKIATVDKNGVVTGVAAGTATITVKAKDGSGKTCSVEVTVISPVTDIKTDADAYEVYTKQKTTISAEVNKDATVKEVSFKSADEKIATINEKGVVTGVKAGKTKVTVTSTDGTKIEKTVDINVLGEVTEITGKEILVTLEEKKDITIPLEITAENNPDAYKTLKASTSDEKIATAKVTKDGVIVTAVAPGVAKISVASDNPSEKNVSYDFTVQVTEAPGEVTSITSKEAQFTVVEKKEITIPVEITAKNNPDAYQTLKVSTSDEKIATAKVTKDGIVVTAVAPGTAKITVASNNPSGSNVSVELTVQVTKAEAVKTEVTPVVKTTQKITTAKVKTYKASSLKKKKVTISLKAKTSGDGALTYKVSKYPKNCKKYITVSKTGKVTLKKGAKKGTYKITITASETDTNKKATKTITIKVK